MATGVSARLTPAEGRRFGFTVGLAFVALSTLLLWRGRERAALVTSAIGGALILGGLLVPARLGPVHSAWMRFAALLSKVTTPAFMAVVYFIVITPVGILRRLLGQNPIDHSAGRGSYWVSRPPGEARRSDIERQF